MNAKLHRRSFTRALLPLFVPALLALASPTISAADRFMRVGDIAGESTDEQHSDWIEIVDFAFGVSAPVSGSGGSGSSGRPILNDVVVLKMVDKASPLLFLKCCTGEVIPTVQINVRGEGGDSPPQVYFTLILSDVRITGVQSDTVGGVAAETISFFYATIQISYTSPSGQTVSAGWDRTRNIPLP